MIVPVMILLVLATSNAKPFSITQMDNSPGLYFEYMGLYTFPNDKWTAITNVELDQLISTEEEIISEMKQCKVNCPGPLTCRINLGRLTYLEYLLNTTRTLLIEIMEIVEDSECATKQDKTSPIIEHNRLKTKLSEIKKIRTATPYPKNPHVGNQYQTIGTWISQTESTLMDHVDFYKQVIIL